MELSGAESEFAAISGTAAHELHTANSSTTKCRHQKKITFVTDVAMAMSILVPGRELFNQV